MKNDFHNPYLHMAARFLPFAAAVYFFSFVSADPDLWGHIEFGGEAWKNKALSRTDPYSFTAYGKPWINHEWLAEVIFYLTYRFLGDAGLLFGKLTIGLLIVTILWKVCSFLESRPLVTAGILTLSVAVLSPAFMIRPQVFSLLFFTLFVFLLYLYFHKEKDRLHLLPFLMALWVNLHGGFLIGWAILLVATGWVTVLYTFSSSPRHIGIGKLWLWVLLTSSATLLNPYGYKLHLFLFRTLSSPRQISEWAPVSLFDLSFLPFKLMILLLIVAILFKKMKGRDTWQIGVIGMTLAASLLHRRHMPFFGIIACPFLSLRMSDLAHRIGTRYNTSKSNEMFTHLLAASVALLAGYQVYSGIQPYVGATCRIVVDPKEYPVSAVEFLRQNDIQGNLLLPFDWGEYAIWHLYPACRVSIDGRFRTVYPETVIGDHFAAKRDPAARKRLIENYPADILLVKQVPFFQGMIGEEGPWAYIYSDPVSIIFLRKHDHNHRLLEDVGARRLEYEYPVDVYFP